MTVTHNSEIMILSRDCEYVLDFLPHGRNKLGESREKVTERESEKGLKEGFGGGGWGGLGSQTERTG